MEDDGKIIVFSDDAESLITALKELIDRAEEVIKIIHNNVHRNNEKNFRVQR